MDAVRRAARDTSMQVGVVPAELTSLYIKRAACDGADMAEFVVPFACPRGPVPLAAPGRAAVLARASPARGGSHHLGTAAAGGDKTLQGNPPDHVGEKLRQMPETRHLRPPSERHT
jgi:hypothetical protein